MTISEALPTPETHKRLFAALSVLGWMDLTEAAELAAYHVLRFARGDRPHDRLWFLNLTRRGAELSAVGEGARGVPPRLTCSEDELITWLRAIGPVPDAH